MTLLPPKPDVGALLAELAARGVELAIEGGRLRYRPAAAVPPSLAERLSACGMEIKNLIAPGYGTGELAVLVRAGLAPADVPMVAALKGTMAPMGPLVVTAVESDAPIAMDLSPDDREVFEERAAILEFEHCMPRERAERLALLDIRAWMSGARGGGAQNGQVG